MLFLSVVALGCGPSATDSAFVREYAKSDDHALLYVFRVSAFTGALYTSSITLNSKPIGEVGSGQYFVRQIEPGEHVVALKRGFFETSAPAETIVRAKPGESYYVQHRIGPAKVIGFAGGPVVQSSDVLLTVWEENALTMLQDLKRVQ